MAVPMFIDYVEIIRIKWEGFSVYVSHYNVMSFHTLSLLLLDILIVSYVAFLIQQAIAYKAKYGYLCEASGLGEKKNKQYKLYNLGYFLFGLMSLSFTYNLSLVLVPSVLTTISSILFYIAGIGLCLIALFPRDMFHSLHTASSMLMFFSGTPSLILMTYPFYLSTGIPRIIIPFNLIIAGLLVYYLYLKFKYFIALGRLDNDTEKYVSIWEWIPFISMYVWFFVVNTILIIGHMT